MNNAPHTRATDRQLSIEFSFQAHQAPNSTNPNGEGLIQFTLQIGPQTYGPYLTAHRATHTAWMQRSQRIPTASSAFLNGIIALQTKNLWDAWKTFPNKRSEITGEMILNRAGMRVFSVAEGGALYVI